MGKARCEAMLVQRGDLCKHAQISDIKLRLFFIFPNLQSATLLPISSYQ